MGELTKHGSARAQTFGEVLFNLYVKQSHLLNQSIGAMELQFRLTAIMSINLALIPGLVGLALGDEQRRSCRLLTVLGPSDNSTSTNY
jgi:stage V sporulation protein SpoVS